MNPVSSPSMFSCLGNSAEARQVRDRIALRRGVTQEQRDAKDYSDWVESGGQALASMADTLVTTAIAGAAAGATAGLVGGMVAPAVGQLIPPTRPPGPMAATLHARSFATGDLPDMSGGMGAPLPTIPENMLGLFEPLGFGEGPFSPGPLAPPDPTLGGPAVTHPPVQIPDGQAQAIADNTADAIAGAAGAGIGIALIPVLMPVLGPAAPFVGPVLGAGLGAAVIGLGRLFRGR